MHARTNRIALVFLAVTLTPVGCATPTATVDLLSVAREGLASARKAQQAGHEQIIQGYHTQMTALDRAFDADVRLVEAGQLKNAEGKPVTLTAEWVVSARAGYAAARDLLAEQIRQQQAAHEVEMDNLAAAGEALDMAQQLTVLQWNIGERFKQQFLKLTQFTTKGNEHGK